MELKQLQYFVAVADQLNFSKAAESLYISQPTLSQQISDLERELGQQLLLRDTRSVELTSAGRAFLKGSKQLLFQAEQFFAETRNCSGMAKINPPLCIGYEGDVLRHPRIRSRLSDVVYEMKQQDPSFRVFFQQLESHGVDNQVKTGGIDLGICFRPPARIDSSLSYRMLCKEELVLTFREPEKDCSPDVKRVLAKYSIMMMERETHGLSQILQLLASVGCTPEIRFFNSTISIEMLVKSGQGAMVIPSFGTRASNDGDLSVITFDDPSARLELLAYWLPSNGNPSVQALLKKI
jgi:DNA-binding transcriptional LysR family regulator